MTSRYQMVARLVLSQYPRWRARWPLKTNCWLGSSSKAILLNLSCHRKSTIICLKLVAARPSGGGGGGGSSLCCKGRRWARCHALNMMNLSRTWILRTSVSCPASYCPRDIDCVPWRPIPGLKRVGPFSMKTGEITNLTTLTVSIEWSQSRGHRCQPRPMTTAFRFLLRMAPEAA